MASAKGSRVALRTVDKVAVLEIELDPQQAGPVDVLVPVVPCPRAIVEQECSLGYDRALAEADAYWRQVPATAARIDVPEQEITQAIRAYLKMAEVVAEKNPATGEYCSLTGAWVYADVWSTPNSMTYAMLLDPMGYHAQAERYLAIFKKRQGITVPPGKAFKPHPGYLGTPREYQAVPIGLRTTGRCSGRFRSMRCFRGTRSSSKSTRRRSSSRANGSATPGG